MDVQENGHMSESKGSLGYRLQLATRAIDWSLGKHAFLEFLNLAQDVNSTEGLYV